MNALYSFPGKPTFPPLPDLAGKVVLVTGGNSGLGYEMCKSLLSHDAKVFLAARTPAKGERAIEELKRLTGKDNIHYIQLDLSSLASIESTVNAFLAQETRLHILFNNAGIQGGAMDEKDLKPTVDGHEIQFATNVLGHHALTMGLLPALKNAAAEATPGSVRVISTGSAAMFFEDQLDTDKLNSNAGKSKLKLYSRSKLGNFVWGRAMAQKFSDQGIYTYTVHPGVISTEILKSSNFALRMFLLVFGRPPVEGAGQILWVGTSPDVKKEDAGAFYVQWMKKHEVRMKKVDEKVTEKLWARLEENRTGTRGNVEQNN